VERFLLLVDLFVAKYRFDLISDLTDNLLVVTVGLVQFLPQNLSPL
jgi:hypothetical protein